MDMMDIAEYANTIDYKVNAYLEDMIRSNSIGEVFQRASKHAEADTVVFNESDLNAAEHPISYDGGAELYDIKRLLCDSSDIDVSYLEPYLHYIQTSAKTNKEWELIDSD